MIIIVCTDDPALAGIAQNSHASAPAMFGNVYQAFAHIPALGVNENLFVIAHGAYKGNDGNPVIGDQNAARAFEVNAVDFYKNIHGIFPAGYTGNVYIDACQGADYSKGAFSFAEVFLAQIRVTHGQTRVFSKKGDSGGNILPAGNAGWTQAQ